MSDRVLGYFIIVALFLFLLSPVSYLIWKSSSPVETRTIQFEQINSLGFLNFQDPVRVRGVEIGSIRSIYNRDHKTFVVIETHNPVRLHKNYNITVTAKGLMGDRFLAINPGDTNTELIDKKKILNGNFQLGPTEAVAYAEQLRSEISRLTALTKEFKYGTAGSSSFISRFNGAMDDFDSLSVSVMAFSTGLDEDLNNSLDSLSDFLKQTCSLTDNLSQSVPGWLPIWKTS